MRHLPLALDVGIRSLGRFIRLVLHAVLQSANPLTDALAKFGQLLWPKHQQSDEEDHQQMQGLEKTFKHKNLLRPRRQLSTLPEAGHIRQFPPPTLISLIRRDFTLDRTLGANGGERRRALTGVLQVVLDGTSALPERHGLALFALIQTIAASSELVLSSSKPCNP